MLQSVIALTLICTPLVSQQASELSVIRDLIPDQDEKEIYEKILRSYQGALVVSSDMKCHGMDDPEGLWKFFCSKRSMKPSGLIIPPFRKAFNNLKSKIKQRYKLCPWNENIKFENNTDSNNIPNITTFWFSPIGFDLKNSIAVVYRAGSQGALAGSGEYLFLRKVNSRWQIEGEITVWIS